MPLTSDAWNNFTLRQATREPGSFRIGIGGGAQVLIGTIPTADLDTILTEGIESATADNDTGKLNRILPVAAPRWNWMFLRNVDNVTGISFEAKQDSDPEGTLEAPAMPYWADYNTYEITATFEPRPYLMARDETISKSSITYYTDDGVGHNQDVWNEWWRYVEWLPQPASEYLTADIGQARWSAPGGNPLNGDPVDGSGASPGMARMLLSSRTWKVTWYAVPYQYVLSDNEVYTTAIGRVNQLSWGGFAPGHALLQAVAVPRVYTAPFPEFTSYAGYDLVGQDKLCDIEFTILEVKRTPTISVTPTNASHVAAGHNCFPFRVNHKFYYMEHFRKNNDAAGTGVPTYLSYPFEFLFQNPEWL